MTSEDVLWFVPLVAVAFAAAVVCHARMRRYGSACLVTSLISGLALMVLYVVRVRSAITLDGLGSLLAWVGVLFVPGFLCGLCVSSLVGVFFLVARRFHAGR